MSMQTCWELAQAWYPGRAERNWQRPNLAETQALFNNLGLNGKFWQLG